jgi:hypothetical protein
MVAATATIAGLLARRQRPHMTRLCEQLGILGIGDKEISGRNRDRSDRMRFECRASTGRYKELFFGVKSGECDHLTPTYQRFAVINVEQTDGGNLRCNRLIQPGKGEDVHRRGRRFSLPKVATRAGAFPPNSRGPVSPRVKKAKTLRQKAVFFTFAFAFPSRITPPMYVQKAKTPRQMAVCGPKWIQKRAESEKNLSLRKCAYRAPRSEAPKV